MRLTISLRSFAWAARGSPRRRAWRQMPYQFFGCGAKKSMAADPGAGSGPARLAAGRPAAAASCHPLLLSAVRPAAAASCDRHPWPRSRPPRLPRGVAVRPAAAVRRRSPRGVGACGGERHAAESSRRPHAVDATSTHAMLIPMCCPLEKGRRRCPEGCPKHVWRAERPLRWTATTRAARSAPLGPVRKVAPRIY